MLDELARLFSAFDLSWWHAAAIFAFLFVCTIALAVFILVRLPATYFQLLHDRSFMNDHHPAIRWVGIIIKNVAGFIVLLWGFAMLIPGVPGQGLLTIFVGLMLLDFPGKRAVERAILRQPAILRAVNKLRGKFSKPPLILD